MSRKGERIFFCWKSFCQNRWKSYSEIFKFELKLSDIEESDAGEYVFEVDDIGETKEVAHQMNVLSKFNSIG